MFRRNLFVVVVLIGLILSAAFTSWTQDTVGAGRTTPPAANSWPPDLTNYTRPATAHDVLSKGASTPVLFQPVEIPNSGGGEPDIAINPLNLNQIEVHAGFGGWTGNAPNFVSSDGGLTWTQVLQIPTPPNIPITFGPADTTQDFGLDGNLYSANLGVNVAATDIFTSSGPFSLPLSYFTIAGTAQLTDFGGTAGFADQPWLLTNVDPFTPGQTNTYVGYDDFNFFPVPTRVSAARGTQPPDFVADVQAGLSTGGGINPGHRLANDPRTGAMYSLHQNCTAGCGGSPKTIDYVLNRSLDAGATWTLNGSGTGVVVATGVTVQPQPKFGTVNALLGGIDHAAVNPTTGAVFVVFGGSNGAGGNAIFIKKITFNNASPTVAILTATVHQVSLPGAQAALPSVAVAPNGTIGVLYTSFDGFSVDAFPIFTAHFASSSDDGVTFNDQPILTFLSPAKDNADPRQRVLGDYQQLKAVNDPQPPNAGATFYGTFTGNGAALGDPIANNNAFFFKVVAAPQINLNPNPLVIGNVCKGSTGSAELDVSDTGADDLLISSITRASGSTDISLATGPTFPVNISPDGSFSFNFNCTPTTFLNKSATFTIASNDPATPAKPLTVTCTTASGVVVTTGSGDFGTPVCGGTTPAQTIKVNNVGGCNLSLVNAFTTCSDFTLVNPPAFPVPISPDSGIDLTVKFTPTSAGPKSCFLHVVTDDPNNLNVLVPLTGTTQLGSASITVPPGITFPPTVIQQNAACPAQIGIPITNNGSCPVAVTAVGITQTSSPLDYSLTGLPGLPSTIVAGGQLGSGGLDLVFEPFTVARESTGTVDVTFVNDPILLTTTTDHIPFCGEATHRGLRVLVTSGGAEVSAVKEIELQSAFGPEQPQGNFFVKRTIKHAALQTVSGSFPCPSFDFHAEFGGESEPLQLKDGTYRLKVVLKVGKKTKTKIVRVKMDTCTFTPNVVVAF